MEQPVSMESDLRRRRCCFTGLHPQSLKRIEDDVKVDLENSILQAISAGYTTFVSGMEYGVDIWASEIVVRLKAGQQNLHLIAAIPYPGFDEEWEDGWRQRYRTLLSQADYVKVLAAECSKEAYQKRNEWMVNHSAKVIAVFNGMPGGTADMLRYARMHKVPLLLLRG